MDAIIAFLLQHWPLSGSFFLILIGLIGVEWWHRSLGLPAVNPQRLVSFVNHFSGIAVDIRDQSQFSKGHILGALNIPRADFPARLSSLNKYKAKPIILVCGTGIDSPKMGRLLIRQGFTQLYYLAGGMAAWHTDNMPLVKGK